MKNLRHFIMFTKFRNGLWGRCIFVRDVIFENTKGFTNEHMSHIFKLGRGTGDRVSKTGFSENQERILNWWFSSLSELFWLTRGIFNAYSSRTIDCAHNCTVIIGREHSKSPESKVTPIAPCKTAWRIAFWSTIWAVLAQCYWRYVTDRSLSSAPYRLSPCNSVRNRSFSRRSH